jgi:hypothetical protein
MIKFGDFVRGTHDETIGDTVKITVGNSYNLVLAILKQFAEGTINFKSWNGNINLGTFGTIKLRC